MEITHVDDAAEGDASPELVSKKWSVKSIKKAKAKGLTKPV